MRTPRILLLMGTSHGYGRELIDGITQYWYEVGYQVDFELRGHLESLPDWVQDWEGEGIIVRHHQPETFAMLEKKGIPFIRLNCPDHVSDVDVDEMAVGEMAVEHFQERGLKHFAFFTQCDHYWTRRRRDGFAQAVKKRGGVCHVLERYHEDAAPFPTWERSFQKRFLEWLHELPKPIGMLVSYDFHARSVLEVCQSEGIAVPEEIAVLGINNEKWFCRLQNPPLSSLIQNSYKTGYETARILCNKIQGKEIPNFPVLFPPVGVCTRRSTDLIAVEDEDVADTLRWIRREACQGLTVERIVAEVGLSRRTLERKFQQAFGRTMKEEIHRVRMERAKELLLESRLPIGNVARSLGFCSHAHFVHIFRQQTGLTPSEFLRQFRVG
ncbi:MAG: DNA-binding transcriptional regulator [Planctomycetia bacterium]|nr:DNA-binding transcriptional regulator [Planctomycetia bacterium]